MTAGPRLELGLEGKGIVVTGASSIISVSPTRIYCVGRPGQLLIVDRNSGNIQGTMPMGAQDVILHNQATDRLILATSTGLLQCLHETKLTLPYVHEVEAEKLSSKRPDVIVDPGDKTLDKPMDMPMDNDPFGAPAKPADDPFGAPAPAAPDKPAAEEDPFGAPAPKKEDKPATDDPFA